MFQITAPGMYEIDIDRYHSDPNLCDAPSISGSGLKQVIQCPARYWAYSPFNPNRFPPEDTKAFAIGRAAHALVLGEPEFNKYFIISPYDDFLKKKARQWRDAQTRTVLKEEDFGAVLEMAKAQRKSAAVMQAFVRGRPEMSFIWRHATGVYLRSRPDWLPVDLTREFIIDYKTCLSIEPEWLSRDAFKRGYHIQAAMQLDGVKAVFGIEPLGIAHVVQEKKPPYLADLRMFTPEQLDFGRYQYQRGVKTFAQCMRTGIWPPYTTEPQYFETPRSIAGQMEEIDDDDYSDETDADENASTDEYGYGPADYFAAG